MYRSVVVCLTATIMAVAMTTTVAAQGRGYHHGGTTFRAAPPGAVAPGPAFIGRPQAPVIVPRVHGAPFGFGRYPRTIIVPPVVGYYSPYVWPSPLFAAPAYSPYVGPAYPEPAYVAPSPPPPAVRQSEVDLAYQVGRLSQEIDQLRQQQNLRPSPPQTQSEPERPATPTVLVFRDGHRMEIQNYAIVGQTLWVLDENVSTKISVADLDLDATQKENRQRGLRFPLPQR